MSVAALSLTMLSALMIVLGELAFKLGLNALPDDEGDFRLLRFVGHLAASPLLWCGVAAYVVEFVAWLAALSIWPLSVAFPVVSLSFCGAVAAGRLVLGEHVSRRRLAGTVLISVGVLIICLGET